MRDFAITFNTQSLRIIDVSRIPRLKSFNKFRMEALSSLQSFRINSLNLDQKPKVLRPTRKITGLSNLEISYCSLRDLTVGFTPFAEVYPSLKSLYLQGNKLEYLPFDFLPQNLEKLDLSSNRIKQLNKDTFNFPRGQKLEVKSASFSHNLLNSFDVRIFSDSIHSLSMANVSLTRFTFRALNTYLKETGAFDVVLDVGTNKFDCLCHEALGLAEIAEANVIQLRCPPPSANSPCFHCSDASKTSIFNSRSASKLRDFIESTKSCEAQLRFTTIAVDDYDQGLGLTKSHILIIVIVKCLLLFVFAVVKARRSKKKYEEEKEQLKKNKKNKRLAEQQEEEMWQGKPGVDVVKTQGFQKVKAEDKGIGKKTQLLGKSKRKIIGAKKKGFKKIGLKKKGLKKKGIKKKPLKKKGLKKKMIKKKGMKKKGLKKNATGSLEEDIADSAASG